MRDRRVMPGIENLEDREFNGVRVERLASRHPVRWYLRCVRCGANWIEDHARVRYTGCRNSSCGHSASEPRATLARTGNPVTAVRSRDSESVWEYQRQQSAASVVKWAAQPSESGMLAADPSSVRAYIDHLEKRN